VLHPQLVIRKPRAAAAIAVAALALTAACGSTVQTTGQAAVGDGLAAPLSQAPAGAATGGAPVQPGATTPGGGTAGLAPGAPAGGAAPAAGPAAAAQGSAPGPQPVGSAVAGVASADRKPIQIGFITTSVGNAQALGANPGNTYTDKAMYEAVVAEYNAAGGVAGHRIVPLYGATDTASSNWASDFSAVCAQFTQDNHVKAVIGYVFVYQPSFESCLAKAGVAHLYGGYQPGDVGAQQEYPNLVATAHPTTDGFTLAALSGALQTGRLTTKTKLGLLVDTCANGERAYTRSTEPWLKAHGISYQTVLVDCARGASDVSAGASAVSSAELRFASSGVDLVYAFGIGLIVFMQQAQSQSYHPQYLTTIAGKAVADNAPAAQVKDLHGFGWMPSVDVDAQHQPYATTPPQRACLAKLAKHGLHPAAYNDFMAAYQACDGLDLYAKALAANGSTAAAAVVRGVVAALPSFRGAGTYAGTLQATSRQRGGAATMREYGWTDSCSCLTYRGPTYPIPTP
jgi:hypothetical protein